MVLIEPPAGHEREVRVRRDLEPAHIIGASGIETGIETRMDEIGLRKRVAACHLIGLAEQHIGVEVVRARHRVLHANIRADAAFAAVIAGELVPFEKRRVLEDEALRILVGDLADQRLVGTRDDLRDRLDGLGA